MGKDPAFLFYSSDFLTGTMMMTDQEVGQYVRLLCFQHQSGHIDATAMQQLCHGNATASIMSKFKIDDQGKYYNERLESEMIKRKKHSEKQRDKAVKRWQCRGNAVAMPLENENENKGREGVGEKDHTDEQAILVELRNSKILPLDRITALYSHLWLEVRPRVVQGLKARHSVTDEALRAFIREFIAYKSGMDEIDQSPAEILRHFTSWLPFHLKRKQEEVADNETIVVGVNRTYNKGQKPKDMR